MIVAVALLGGLLLLYWAVSQNVEELPVLGTVETEESNIIMLAEFDYTDIKELSFECGETSLSFVCKDSVWQIKGDEKFPLDTYTVTEMAKAIASIGANRHVVNLTTVSDKSAALVEYGFDEPFCTIKVTYDDAEYEYILGDHNSFSYGYYFRIGEGDDIYMIADALYDYFDYTSDDLIVLDKMPEYDSGAFAGFKLTTPDGEKETEDIDAVSSLIDIFVGTELTRWVEYGVAESDLEKYGLSEDKRTTLTALISKADESNESKMDNIQNTGEDNDSETEYETFSIYYGDTTEDGQDVYLTIEGSTIVYKTGLLFLDEAIMAFESETDTENE